MVNSIGASKMMKTLTHYLNVLESLSLPRQIVDCAAGRIAPPLTSLEAPAQWYGFPPALIPIWSDGSRPFYIGAWKHWFTDRDLTFVKMYVASGRLTVEIARTVEQLLSFVAMMAISIHEGIEPRLENFAESVGLSNLAEIDAVSLESGDNPKGFVGITCFKSNVPQESVAELRSYSGNFPVNDLSRGSSWLNGACFFELSESIRTLIGTLDQTALPPWLQVDVDPPQLFREFMACGDLPKAWLTLNSPGWSISQARSALTDLEKASKDSDFSKLVAAWLSMAEVTAGSY